MIYTVNDIYEFLKFLLSKNQAGGVSASRFFYAWNAEQNSYMSDLIGRFNSNNNGKVGINTGLIQNEVIMTKIAPFIEQDTTLMSGSQYDKPADFLYCLSLRVGNARITKINHDQVYSVNQSSIDPPSSSTSTYYAVQYGDYYTILPSIGSTVTMDYIKQPPNIKWGYTINSDGRQQYDPASSVQPLWGVEETQEITKRTLKMFGVSLKDGDYAAYGQSVIASGT